jgi:hypothetical protein
MSTHHAIPSRGSQVVIPAHLLPWLRAAADYELELACDTGGEWSEEIRDRVVRAARSIDALEIGLITGHTIEALTGRAITGRDLPFRPADLPEADAHHAHLDAIRELIALRAEARRRVTES